MQIPEAPSLDVFISYAGPDRARAAALALALESAEISAWWDGRLAADTPFEHQIQRVLAETRLIVAILSPRTLDSEWVRWELSQATQNGLHLIALLVNGLSADELPPPLHLVTQLSLADETDASMTAAAVAIKALVAALTRSPRHAREDDARRRLASAAASIARQAADIKQRRTGALPEPPIIVGSLEQRFDRREATSRFLTSDGLAGFLREQRTAIAVTSFQSDELYVIGHRAETGQLTIDIQPFRKPTGLAVHDGHIVVATLAHVYRLENLLRPGQRLDGTYTHCYAPRLGFLTGVLDAHDVALTACDEALIVATRYNCLATVSRVHSFKPLWKPPFITEIVGEDRCHLNGLAMRGGAPAFVTALACSNGFEGWRDRRADGGVAIDVRTNAVVCEGLSMPHSPRLHDDRLWLLNSGAGELGVIDVESGLHRFHPVAHCPGFARGLAFHGRFAAVTLSKPREDQFAGLPLGETLRGHDAWCGIQIVDTASGRCVHWLRIDGQVRELYDVAFLPDVVCPRTVSPLTDEGFDLVTIEQ